MFDCSVTLRRSREANPAIRYYLPFLLGQRLLAGQVAATATP
ncbi:hypothetical protein [Psychrobacter sp. SMN/5/1215-MNA-CIBAN-0208]